MSLPMHRARPFRHQQRGAAALAVSLLLLFGMTVLAFFANRNMIFEQRTSANQFRSTKAFEMAEAGLEWAVAQLNSESTLNVAPSCVVGSGTALSYAERYLAMDNDRFLPVASTTRRLSACRIASNGAVNCTCPAAGTAPSLGSNDEPRFLVEFLTGPTPWTVHVISRGCTNAGAFCGDTGTADGTAVVRAMYSMAPAFPSAPGAGLITGANASTGGNLTVINKDPKSNGVTINSGNVVNLGTATSAISLDGTPARASVLDNDPALRDLTNAPGDTDGNLFFRSFFNDSIAEYQSSLKTYILTSGTCPASATGRCSTCGSAGDCAAKLGAAYSGSGNFERFWLDTPIDLGTANDTGVDNTYGSATRPLQIASSSNISFSGNITAYGLFYAATASADDLYEPVGVGNVTVFGAIASRGSFTKGNGNMRLIYDANLFNPTQSRGLVVRLPGSWRDALGEL